MKKLNIFLAVLCMICIAANVTVTSSLVSKFDKLNSRLDQLEIQLSGVRSSTSSFNNVPKGAGVTQKDVFTPSELAEYLGVEMSKIYDLIDAKGVGLPYVCIDGEYRFGREAIDEWLKSNKGTIIGN